MLSRNCQKTEVNQPSVSLHNKEEAKDILILIFNNPLFHQGV